MKKSEMNICYYGSATCHDTADKYAKPFYCLASGLNMKSGQIHQNILNIEMNMWESTIG
jgi:hypothetical protein